MQTTRTPRQLDFATIPHPDDAARVARLGAVVAILVPDGEIAGVLVALGRRAHGYTQATFAARIGVARSTVAAMETAAQRITPARAAAISDELGIPLDLLETR